ncbi:MAG: HNH endonuclease signature motif containing protein [Gammaproteobacteria bacterium]
MKNVKDRFEGKYVKAGVDKCWLWLASCFYDGYGSFTYKGRRYGAHRISWMLQNGPIPKGMCVLHRCDVKSCVNPSHLFLGTYADNAIDKVKKNRQAKGDVNGRAKLTEQQVREIRWTSGDQTQRDLGRIYGVSHAVIGYIVNRKNWKHVL